MYSAKRKVQQSIFSLALAVAALTASASAAPQGRSDPAGPDGLAVAAPAGPLARLVTLVHTQLTAGAQAVQMAASHGWAEALAADARAKAGRGSGVDTTIVTSATVRSSPQAAMNREVAARASGVFGSVAIGFRRLPALEKMAPSYRQIAAAPVLDCRAGTCGPARRALADAVESLRGEGFLHRVRTVNSLVNGFVAYKRDIDNYGVIDHWATPGEILKRRAGDCEDYAILKLALLESLGVPASSMSIVILGDERRNLFHAVLTVRTSQGVLVLDNLRDAILKDSELPHYTPLYSLSAGKGFIHGRRAGGERMLVSGDRLRAVAPGEGPSSPAMPAERG